MFVRGMAFSPDPGGGIIRFQISATRARGRWHGFGVNQILRHRDADRRWIIREMTEQQRLELAIRRQSLLAERNRERVTFGELVKGAERQLANSPQPPLPNPPSRT
jgi:hypothetical protein